MPGEFTELLAKSSSGDRLARDAVFELAFGRLRRIAASLIARERWGPTLQATVLVNEAFATRLHDLRAAPSNTEHFFSLAARAMRQVLIDRGRCRGAVKNTPTESLRPIFSGCEQREQQLQIATRMALNQLADMDRLAAETIRLRYMDGYTVGEIAEVQKRERWRVTADCEFGLDWMKSQLRNFG